jgi:hypothetical protein
MITDEKTEDSIETVPAQKVAPASGVSIDDTASELNEPRWSVVSFDKREATGLTYTQAEAKMDELLGQRVYGLCIVTDSAGEKVASRES